MAKKQNHWAPDKRAKKTTIGNGKNTRHKALNSNGTIPKGYKKKYRGQGKGK